MLASGLGVYGFVKWGNEQGTASACPPHPAAKRRGGINPNETLIKTPTTIHFEFVEVFGIKNAIYNFQQLNFIL